MPQATRIGDPYSDVDAQAVGSGNVFINVIPVARLGDATTGHGCWPPANVSAGSPNVFVNNLNMARVGDPHSIHCCPPIPECHGGNFIAGSPDVLVNQGVGGAQPNISFDDAVMRLQDEEPEVAPLPATDPRQLNKNAAYTIAFGPNFVFQNNQPPTLDTTPPPSSETIPSDCTDIFTHKGSFLGSFRLSEHFVLSQLTTNTIVSNYPLRAQVGLTQQQIVCNLRKLCVNILEPLIKIYGNIQINSGFRHAGNGATNSQHFKGEAADVTFTDISLASQFNQRAVEIKNKGFFDQFIYEQNKPQRSSTWYHLSYVDAKRGQVLTKKALSNKYFPGLYELSFS